MEKLVNGLTRLQGNARGSNNFSRSSKEVRDDYQDCFNSPEGAISWQTDVVTSTRNSFDIDIKFIGHLNILATDYVE